MKAGGWSCCSLCSLSPRGLNPATEEIISAQVRDHATALVSEVDVPSPPAYLQPVTRNYVSVPWQPSCYMKCTCYMQSRFRARVNQSVRCGFDLPLFPLRQSTARSFSRLRKQDGTSVHGASVHPEATASSVALLRCGLVYSFHFLLGVAGREDLRGVELSSSAAAAVGVEGLRAAATVVAASVAASAAAAAAATRLIGFLADVVAAPAVLVPSRDAADLAAGVSAAVVPRRPPERRATDRAAATTTPGPPTLSSATGVLGLDMETTASPSSVAAFAPPAPPQGVNTVVALDACPDSLLVEAPLRGERRVGVRL